MKTHISTIVEWVLKAQKEEVFFQPIFDAENVSDTKNEFVFFLKPELTLPDAEINLEEILNLINSKFEEFDFTVSSIKLLSAKYLDKHNIIGKHYGVINQLANNAKEHLSEDAKRRFEEAYHENYDTAHILGGFEFLKEHTDFSAVSLFYLWQNLSSVKLGGGAYCVKLRIDKEPTYVVNGFHPNQLLHFTQKGRSIVVFNIKTNTDWSIARNNFTGLTNPEQAKEGSIRRILLDNSMHFNLSGMDMSKNGVHLSAGAVEGLAELVRFNSDFENNNILPLTHFAFGKQLAAQFDAQTIAKIISNQLVLVDGKPTTVFDLTEEKNSDEAIEWLKKYVK